MIHQPIILKKLKTSRCIFITLAAFSCLMAGCKGKLKDEPPADPATLQSAFASADADTKATIDGIISNINAAHYDGAIVELYKVYQHPGLTPDQQKVVLGVRSFALKKGEEAAKAGTSRP